jgi:hypothetical protein
MHALLETEHSIMTDATSLANNLEASSPGSSTCQRRAALSFNCAQLEFFNNPIPSIICYSRMVFGRRIHEDCDSDLRWFHRARCGRSLRSPELFTGSKGPFCFYGTRSEASAYELFWEQQVGVRSCRATLFQFVCSICLSLRLTVA